MSDSAFGLGSIWVRVDDRLIHGQVTVGWRQYLRYAEIWVVDDGARDDPYLQDALRLAAPDGVVVRVAGVEEAITCLSSSPPWCRPSAVGVRGGLRGGAQACEVLLLVKSPEAALALVEGGIPLERLNVGNLSARSGSVRAFKNISLTQSHVEVLDGLARRGVRITFQLTPEDAQADWTAVRRRLRM